MDQDVQREIDSLKREISLLKNTQNPSSLNRYISTTDKKIIEDVVTDNIIDTVWENYFYYSTWFESPDGFNIVNDVTMAGGGCAVTSPGTGTASSSMNIENLAFSGGFSFSKPSRWRATAQFTRTASQDIRIGVGACASVGAHSYGFRINGSTLQGFSQTSSAARTTTDIKTISASTEYDLEARLFPGYKVEFFVDGVPAGAVSTNLPTSVGTKLFEIEATESSAETKQIFIGSFEYIQTTK